MRYYLLLLLMCFYFYEVRSQSCTELLSRAEQLFRNGQFNSIRDASADNFCRCLGIYKAKSNGNILPVYYRALIDTLKKWETIYADRLGVFKDYSDDFIITEDEFNARDRNLFTPAETERAFELLGNLYAQLGVKPLAEHFALRAMLISKSSRFANDSTGFNRIYKDQLKRLRGWSIGPIAGWLYNTAVDITQNLPGNSFFKYVHSASVIMGGEINYYLKPNAIINFNLVLNNTRVTYIQKLSSSTNEFDAYFFDKQNWVRIPVLFRWSPANHLNLFKVNGRPFTKIFLATGFAADYLVASNNVITDFSSNQRWYNLSLTGNRNRLNFEYLLEVYARFDFTNDCLNFGFTGSRLLEDMSNQKKIFNSPLYVNNGIAENNYKLLFGLWKISYEFRFDRIKKKG